jgi:asparagine synthase (glutamine-hydrolysing)
MEDVLTGMGRPLRRAVRRLLGRADLPGLEDGAQHVKVALSADGGDELFNGYSHYGILASREQAMSKWPKPARAIFSKSLQSFGPGALTAIAENLPIPSKMRHAARRNLVERLEKLRVMLPNLDRTTLYDLAMSSWTPWEIDSLLGSYAHRDTTPGCARPSFADQMAHCDIRHFLPDDILVKVDRTTMACGLEGREPLLDHRVAEFALACRKRCAAARSARST